VTAKWDLIYWCAFLLLNYKLRWNPFAFYDRWNAQVAFSSVP